MAWLKVEQSLREHRKILALAEALRISEPQAVGHLVYLWLWALDNISDGILPKSSKIIAKVCDWSGHADRFVQALIDAELVDSTEGDLTIHDWQDYSGRLLKQREDKRNLMRERRAKASESASQPDDNAAPACRNGAGTVPELCRNGDGSVPHLEKSREEKRREEKNKHLSTGAGPADDFDAFWTLYPRKEGKGQARRAFTSAAKKIGANAVIDGLKSHLEALKAKERQFIPLPATWLNGERWTDELDGPPSPPTERDKRLIQLRGIPPESREFFCRQHGWGDEWREVGSECVA